MYLDTLKVSTLEQTADQTTARGGKGNAELIAWDFNKAINLNLEDALYTPASQSLMWGGKFGVKKPKIRGLWNPRVYPKDRYGRNQYVKRVKMVYSADGAIPGFYREDMMPIDSSDKDGLQLSCRKVTNPFWVGPITSMTPLVNAFTAEFVTIQDFDQYNEGNWNVHAIDNLMNGDTPKYRNSYRNENFSIKLQSLYPDVEIYRKSAAISDSANVQDLNDTNEYYYFTFITPELIEAYEAIYAEFKRQVTNDAVIADFVTNQLPASITYMKAHENELGVFNEAHLISETVKDVFLYALENYFKNDFFARTTYDLNACETAYEKYKYIPNEADFKYQELDESYLSKLICPLGYDTIEEEADGTRKLLSVYNWSSLSSKLDQSTRPERAEIVMDNYGDFNYHNQSMSVSKVVKIGDSYLDTRIGTSRAFTRKSSYPDNYDNNKALVMEYMDFYNSVAKKDTSFTNLYEIADNYVIYLDSTAVAGETISWDQVMAKAADITVVNNAGGDPVNIKFHDGTYGHWEGSAVVNPDEKNNSAMQAGFFTKYRKKGTSAATNHVFFNLSDRNYQYLVKTSGTYKYEDTNTAAKYVYVPKVFKSNNPKKTYDIAEMNVEALMNAGNKQFASNQFIATVPSNDAFLSEVCLYGKDKNESLIGCTNSKTAHSYVWTDTNLKMMSLEGDQDIYYSEHANLRYRTPQNSSVKEIGIAQQGFYMTSVNESYKVRKKIAFTFKCYNKTGDNEYVVVQPTKALMSILNDFHSTGAATKIINQLKQTDATKKTPIQLGEDYYGDFTITDASALDDFKAAKCNEYIFADKAASYIYPNATINGVYHEELDYPTVPISMSIVVKGLVKGDYEWKAINDEEITSITSLERRFNERESYGYFLKDYSPIVSFYKTIKTKSAGGNTNIIRVPVGDFYIVSDWNYDGSTAYDYPYAIESGMEDTAVLDRMEKCVATQTFAINTSRNVTMFNYFTIPAYSHTNLTAYIDPRTMKPFEPNADSFTRKNGDVIEGTLRIIKKDTVYYKQTRTVAPEHNAVGRTITVTADQFPGTFMIRGEAYARLRDDGKDRRYQFEIPLAKLSSETNLTLQADGDPTTFNMNFKVLRKGDGKMIKFTQYDVDNQEYNGYRSGSTKVVATDISAITTDNEIAKEVNAI